MKKVGVIGAGLSGLSMIKHLISEPGKFEVKCFDRAAQVGGEWVYMPTTEDNAFGARATALYDYLRTNGFREATKLLDHEFPEGVSLWPTWRDMQNFFQSYADKHQLHQYVQLNTQVDKVKPAQDSGQITWKVTTRSLTEGTQNWTFDVIIVCIGLYHEAIMPDIPGKELFKGSMKHSYQHRSREEFRDKRVVIVGAGPSGHDIALCARDVAKKVYCSAKKWFYSPAAYTGNLESVGLIKRFTPTSMILEDGREIEVDDVLFCTGYTREFPFMDPTAHVKSEQQRVSPLYKGIVHTEFPSSLFFIGLKEFSNIIGTVTVQVRFVLSILLGNADLPSVEVMNQEVKQELEDAIKAGQPPKVCHYLGLNQTKYIAELEKIGNLEPSPVSMWRAFEALLNVYFDGTFEILRDTQYIIKDNDNFEIIQPIEEVSTYM